MLNPYAGPVTGALLRVEGRVSAAGRDAQEPEPKEQGRRRFGDGRDAKTRACRPEPWVEQGRGSCYEIGRTSVVGPTPAIGEKRVIDRAVNRLAPLRYVPAP